MYVCGGEGVCIFLIDMFFFVVVVVVIVVDALVLIYLHITQRKEMGERENSIKFKMIKKLKITKELFLNININA